VAPTKLWKYSVSPSERLRVEHSGQESLREQKCSEPSNAINTRPSKQRNDFNSPRASTSFTIVENTESKWSVGAPSNIWRIWLSQGIDVIPKSVCAFERPRPRPSASAV
jgi:hypothetical protein